MTAKINSSSVNKWGVFNLENNKWSCKLFFSTRQEAIKHALRMEYDPCLIARRTTRKELKIQANI